MNADEIVNYIAYLLSKQWDMDVTITKVAKQADEAV